VGDDQAFRERVRARDPAALGQVFEAYWQALYARARLILPARLDPEDVAGDVMLRLVEEAETYDPARPLYPWLAQVCVNLCLDRSRRYRPISWWRRIFRSQTAAAPVSDLECREARNALLGAVRDLSRKQREAMVLRHLFGLEEEEIAGLQGVSRGQARRLLLEGLREVQRGRLGEQLGVGAGNPEGAR
jgi:RNA polymerase sigma-70 factor (ECF subfamily)